MSDGQQETPPACSLQTLLAGECIPGIYRWTSGPAAADVAVAAAEAGWRSFCLDGSETTGKASFLNACATAFGFPEWFGSNWDALADSLADLSWAPAERGYLVLFDGWETLARTAPSTWRTVLDVFEDAVAWWGETDTPMIVLLRGPHHGRLSGVPALTG